MRAAVLTGAHSIELVDVEPPPLVEGSVHVAIDRCRIGGPDLEAWATGDLPAPAWFGHEWVGRITAVGPGVVGRFEGERVVGATSSPCGGCRACRAGLGDNCLVALSMIVGTDERASPYGGFSELIRVDASRVHRAPEGIDDNEAALTEPAAVAAHAVARGGQRLGDIVVVVGVGTIGLLVAELARLAGAAKVVAIDTEANRRELACSLGADAGFAPGPSVNTWLEQHGPGLGADVVYECAGDPGAVVSSVAAARPGGTVVMVGVSKQSGLSTSADLVARELTIRASLGYTVADVRRALELMADDRFRVDAVCDRVVGFGELAAVFEELDAHPAAPRKVLFSPEH